MRRISKTIIYLLTLLIMVMGVGVSAAPLYDETVGAEEIENNDVVLFGEDFELQEGGVVNGDVTLFGGNAMLAGTTNGDVVMFGGNLTLTESAVITGDCVTMGGSIKGEHTLDCITAGNFQEDLGGIFNPEEFTDGIDNQIPTVIKNRESSSLGILLSGAFSAIAMGLIALGIAANFPDYLNRVIYTVREKPVVSGTVGVLTAIAAPSLIGLVALISTPLLLLFCVGLVGYVVAFGLVLLVAAAGLFGWVSMGAQLVERFGERLNVSERPFAHQVAIGTMILTMFYTFVTAILPGDMLWTVLFVSIGLGAVALTKFGRESYPPIGTINSTEVPLDV